LPKEPVRVRVPGAADADPIASEEALYPVRALAVMRAHLSPEHRLRAATRDLCERQRKSVSRGLPDAVRREQAALPTELRTVVPNEEVDEHLDPRRLVDAQRGLFLVPRLRRPGHAVAPGRWIRLVPVLREPERYGSPRVGRLPFEPAERRHRDRPAVAAAAGDRAFAVRVERIWVVGVGVQRR